MWKRIVLWSLCLGVLLGSGGVVVAAEVGSQSWVLPQMAEPGSLALEAPSAVLMELETGVVLYEDNARQLLAPASVTKVMTLLLIMEAIDSGKIQWTDPVTASETAAAKGGSQVYLKAGEVMTVEEMVKSIAVSSANDCACAMAEHLAGSEEAFVQMMNRRAVELGMTKTHFVNCTGLDDEPEASEHLTCAYDIALMSRELLKNHPDIKKYTTIWMDSVRGGTFGLSNTNKLVRFYNGTTGLKTGYTSRAGHCLSASAQRDGMELVAVVLNCPSSNARFQSAKSLLDHGFANYALVTVLEEELPRLPVVLGQQEQVALEIRGEEKLLVEKGRKQNVTRGLQLPEELQAPVAQGETVGTLVLEAGGQILGTVPVVAAEAVEKCSWWQVLLDCLERVFMSQ